MLHDGHLEVKSCFYEGQHRKAYVLPIANTPFTEILRGNFKIITEGAGAAFPAADFLHLSQSSSFIGCPMLGHQGQVLGVIYAYSKQPMQIIPHVEELLSVIAARAAAECERMHYVRELSHSEEMLRTLFNSTAEAIVGIDLNGQVVFLQPFSSEDSRL